MAQMDLENLRQSWQSIRIEVDKVKEQNRDLTQKIFNNQVRSVRDYVKRRYRMLFIIGIAYTFIMPWLCVREFHMTLVPTILFSLFFPFSAVLNGSVLYKTSRIHPSTMTVRQMLIAFTNLKIHRSRCRIIGYLVAIPAMGVLLYYMRQIDEIMFYAGCLGGVIGAIIGIIMDIRVTREINGLRRSLAEELED